MRALSYGYISGYRASHIVRAVLCRRIIEIFTSNYPGNARLLHSITANFSHPSSSMHFDISKIRSADMPETIPRQTIRGCQISHETPDTHGGANSRDLQARRKCALNVTYTSRNAAEGCSAFSQRWYVTRRGLRRKVAPASRELITRDVLSGLASKMCCNNNSDSARHISAEMYPFKA